LSGVVPDESLLDLRCYVTRDAVCPHLEHIFDPSPVHSISCV